MSAHLSQQKNIYQVQDTYDIVLMNDRLKRSNEKLLTCFDKLLHLYIKGTNKVQGMIEKYYEVFGKIANWTIYIDDRWSNHKMLVFGKLVGNQLVMNQLIYNKLLSRACSK